MGNMLVVGNWKCNGSLESASALAAAMSQSDFGHVDVAVCPPFVHLSVVRQMLGRAPVRLGAQNLGEHGDGAYTGEVSAAMLRDLGCRYVIVGHSERRALFGDGAPVVARKLQRAFEAGLDPILCVGESLAERQAGTTREVVLGQLAASGLSMAPSLVIAYEPVWAIGSGLSATVEQVEVVHGWIREWLLERFGVAGGAVSILYGGSVKPENAAALFGCQNVDGGLIGGASLSAADFIEICRQAESARVAKTFLGGAK